MTEKETHPTWFQAAFAVLARDLARVDQRLDELETILGHLVADEAPPLGGAERQDRAT